MLRDQQVALRKAEKLCGAWNAVTHQEERNDEA